MSQDNSTFVAGHYTFGYGIAGSEVDCGTTEQGFTFTPQFFRDDIRIDEAGDAIVDGIFRGYNLRVRASLSQYAATGVRTLSNPFDASTGSWTLGNIGQTLVGGAFAQSAKFAPMATSGNPGSAGGAAVNSNSKTYTCPLTVPDGDHGAWNLNTRLRRVEVNLLVLVNKATGVMFTMV